jgi:hypothetical protein
MIQTSRNACLAAEAILNLRCTGQLGGKDFDRYVTVKRELVRKINRAHSSTPQPSLDPI